MGRRPGKTKARQPVADAQVVLVEGLTAMRNEKFPAVETEIDLAILDFVQRAVIFET